MLSRVGTSFASVVWVFISNVADKHFPIPIPPLEIPPSKAHQTFARRLEHALNILFRHVAHALVISPDSLSAQSSVHEMIRNLHNVIKRLLSASREIINTHLMHPSGIGFALDIPARDDAFVAVAFMLEQDSDAEDDFLL